MFKQTLAIAYYTLLEALRNRLMWLVALVAIVGIVMSGFLNQLAITESAQVQLALLAAFLRLCAVFLVATFVVTSMVREFNDKGVELVLALPLPRAGYLLGKLAGFAGLSLVPALLFGLLTALLAPWEQSALWTASLVCELWMVAVFSVLCVLTFQQIMTALSMVMAFYLLARSIGALQLIGHGPLSSDAPSHIVINYMVDAIAMLLPRLDTFTRTDWLTYHVGHAADLLPLLLQTAVYLALLCGAALFDLYRKNL